MADFAKDLRATDGGQVIAYKDHDEDGAPALRYVTELDGITGNYVISFVDNEEGYRLRDRAFEQVDVKEADAMRHLMRGATT